MPDFRMKKDDGSIIQYAIHHYRGSKDQRDTGDLLLNDGFWPLRRMMHTIPVYFYGNEIRILVVPIKAKTAASIPVRNFAEIM
jgi:hypothetical protein